MSNYSDGEFAWTSFSSVSKCIPIEHYGSNTRDKDKVHPTQKPIGILRRIIQASSNPGDLVLDFFAGSGTTGLAALEAGRRTLLIDDNQEAFDVMKERLTGHPVEFLLYKDMETS